MQDGGLVFLVKLIAKVILRKLHQRHLY